MAQPPTWHQRQASLPGQQLLFTWEQLLGFGRGREAAPVPVTQIDPHFVQMDFSPLLVLWLWSERFPGKWKGAKSCHEMTLTSRQAGNVFRWEKGRRAAINSNLLCDKGN